MNIMVEVEFSLITSRKELNDLAVDRNSQVFAATYTTKIKINSPNVITCAFVRSTLRARFLVTSESDNLLVWNGVLTVHRFEVLTAIGISTLTN